MTEYYSVVHNDVSSKGLLKILENTSATEIIILSELEWELPGLNNDVLNAYKDKNVQIKVVLGSSNTETIYETIYWPTFWINWTYENLRWVSVPELDLKYPFISLNNRSHYHRCVFIDEMSKQNLIDKGIVTWVKHLNENPDFPYTHFDNRQLLLSDGFDKKLDSFLFPEQYNQSLFHVITEATHKSIFITEKTMIPTFLKKPYIVLGAQGFNQFLTQLGFELYDEIFDYSFDNEPDIFKRTELFVNNVNRITDIDLNETYLRLLPKITRNYNRAMEIKKDKNLIPDVIKECLRDNDPADSIYIRYFTFLND